MSIEILKALMELFALIVKQDGGMLKSERDFVLRFLEKQLGTDDVTEYINLFDSLAGEISSESSKVSLTVPSVRDSVKILNICKKINKTLNQEQKVVVLLRLYELVNSDKQFTEQRMNIITTVSEVFRISAEELDTIEQFVRADSADAIKSSSILIISPDDPQCEMCLKLKSGYSGTSIFILRIESVDLYFIKYNSSDQLFLNGLPISSSIIYTLAKGSSVKSNSGRPIYYSNVAAWFLSEVQFEKISFTLTNVNHKFPDGNPALSNINFSESEGKLIGIMGSSGTGKTTLLNIMAGITDPSSGTVTINGFNLADHPDELEGVIGFVPQDNLLIEELTVFENLYFAAALCFRHKTKSDLTGLVDKTLQTLGLYDKRDLVVGSHMNKVISGGQRKRLNIALELIREPSILFLDEPTSGLSSADSSNVLDLLRELTLKGKLVITVIHQPSSDIYKMFDKIMFLDQGGKLVYYGNPIEAITYFKKLAGQIKGDVGECPTCGVVNPEQIFNIIETEVIDEFGRYTGKRKIKPAEWENEFNSSYPFTPVEEVNSPPPSNLKRPNWFKQFTIFISRDVSSKLSNKQYLALTLLSAPALGYILSFIVRYIADPSSNIYVFRENENIPTYIFMSLIVVLFLGLSLSAEELFRDRKILKREQFLNLSRSSYLVSKIFVLTLIAAFQSFLFLIIANNVLEVRGMFFEYWLALFATALFANLLGLNISTAFNSAVTIYIVIPLLMIPMMVLSGAMFPFDKINRKIGSVESVPMIAEIMPTRWTYEALMVCQFTKNEYYKIVYDWKKTSSVSDFNTIYRIPAIRDALNKTVQRLREGTLDEANSNSLKLVENEVISLGKTNLAEPFSRVDELVPSKFNLFVAQEVSDYLDIMTTIYLKLGNDADNRLDRFTLANIEKLDTLYNRYHNDRLEEIVRKVYEKNKIVTYNNKLIQVIDPVFFDPDPKGMLNFRAHYFSPKKYFAGKYFDTFYFNIALVILTSLFLYILLYFNILKRVIDLTDKIRITKKQ